MDNSIVLARFLGIIFLVGGVLALVNRRAMSAAIDGVADNAGALWSWGFINVLLGAAVIALQNGWTFGWRILIPICGWAALLKGIWIMFLPGSATTVYHRSNTPGNLICGGVVAVILALIFLRASL